MLTMLLAKVRAMFGKRHDERELDDELRAHFEMLVEQNVQRGMSFDDARRGARLELGGAPQIKEAVHDQRGVPFLESIFADIRYAGRMLRRSPGFTTVAVLTLALGIGANTAIFSLIDAVMLRYLPVRQPEQLVQVAMLTPRFSNGHRTSFTNPLWEALRNNQDVFSGVFAWGESQFNLAQGGVEQDARGIFVSGDYFGTLGVRPAAGRLLSVNDDKRGCAGTAVLSYGFWQAHFGGTPKVIGSMLPIAGHPFRIIGVSDPRFFGTQVGSSFDVAVPICSELILSGKDSSLGNRSSWWFHVIGRPKPVLTTDQVLARLSVLSPRIFAATVPSNWNPAQKASYMNWKFVTAPAATGNSSVRSGFDTPLKMLMAIAGLVLLIACANIASLMLARAASRRREIAVRFALGASRVRIVRQLLTECIVLSVTGAAIGIMVAHWSGELLVRYISTEHTKIYLDLTLDGRILAFTGAVAIVTGLLFGVLPALRSTRLSLAGSMKGAAIETTSRDMRFHSGYWTVAVQVALSLVLVITAALFIRSFAKLATLDAGFDHNDVLVANVDTHDAKLSPQASASFSDQLLVRIRALPEVVSASRSVVTPMSNSQWDDFIVVEGKNTPTGDDSDVYMNYVTPGYFQTLRTPLLEGRDFNERDADNTFRAVIINQALARRFFPGVDPIGKTIRRYATSTTLSDPIEVVGIVGNSKYDSLREDFPPIAYFPLAEVPFPVERSSVLIRTATRPSVLASSVAPIVVTLNPSVTVEFNTLAQQVNDSIVQERLLASLSGFFGALALLIAMIGLYGVLAYLVLQRQKEIGIRMALGAQRTSVVWLVLRDVALMLAIGIVAGVGIAWGTGRIIQGLLFGLEAHSIGTIAVSIALLAAVAFLASYLPARRATRVDPMTALRYE
ncbi:MAG: ADOP family duplicated permease [Candidatus Acidiferrales bacterium]